MGLFQPSNRQGFTPPAQAGECCPLCDQPIGQDTARRIEAKRREHEAAAFKQAQDKMAGVLEQKLAEARAQERKAAETALTAKLTDMQARLAQELQAKAAAAEQIAALKAEQQAAVQKQVAEALEAAQKQKEDLQRQKETAVLAANSKVLKLQSELADMQRKLEGKTANELGEGSEIDLFEQLRAAFETDRVQRVPKGVNGADVIHEVVHNGKVCGRIIYDAKNRDAWQNGFAVKLKADKLAQAADFAILSSNKFPKDKAHIHNQDGVIVANPARVLALVEILREQLVRMLELRVSNEARGSKMEDLYSFITSEHCRQLIEQVEAQAGKMLDLDSKEVEAHRRLWDQRKKLITAVQRARGDLSFEIDRIIGTAGNGTEPPDEEAA
jgi:hypothetical protein